LANRDQKATGGVRRSIKFAVTLGSSAYFVTRRLHIVSC